MGNEIESHFFSEKSLETEQAILSKMYDEESGLLYSLDARHSEDELIEVNTVSSLMPPILDTISEASGEIGK